MLFKFILLHLFPTHLLFSVRSLSLFLFDKVVAQFAVLLSVAARLTLKLAPPQKNSLT
jgi:hypothetical protein